MMVEKVPDSTYEMVGGLDKQIKEIKEVIELPVKHPELFDALGISQPKVCSLLLFNFLLFNLGCFTLWSTRYW
jgi:26S proteasome regulatory subunit T6